MSALLLASEVSHDVATSPLTAAVLLPFLGAVVVALIPAGRAELHRLVALLFATGTGAITLWLLAAFDTHDPGFQFEVNRSWIPDFGISWHLGIDGVSLLLVVLTGLLFPLAIIPNTDPVEAAEVAAGPREEVAAHAVEQAQKARKTLQ